MEHLKAEELRLLINRVFQPTPEDHSLAILIDLPDAGVADHSGWKSRREMARGWRDSLREIRDKLTYDVNLYLYRNVHSNNADLPDKAWLFDGDELPEIAEDLPGSKGLSLRKILSENRLVLAPTEFSTTAPLKLLAPDLGFRAATMPGFGSAMIEALRLDYTEINRRVHHVKEILDRAECAVINFLISPSGNTHQLDLDLRHRTSHASGGLLPRPGLAGNLPSGETYIVPYEGEIEGDPSRSAGELPVQFGEEIVVYRIEANRAVEVTSQGVTSRAEAAYLAKEPGYGNIAELGFGVLSDFGLKPIGEILLDEKLGLHIAFGRSDHFGGEVGASQFSSPEAVVHIDRVYLPETQPRVEVTRVVLELSGGEKVEMVRRGKLVVGF